MKKQIKKFTALMLVALMFSTPAFSYGGYSVNNTYQEYYNASSPIGTEISYNGCVPTPYYGNNGYYNQYPYQEGYQVNVPAGGNYYARTITTPQSYNRYVSNTQTYVDNRPLFDRNIDRAGKIVGILGGAAILGLGTAALIKAF